MKRTAMILALFVSIGLKITMAQNVQITGTITSSEDKQPLIGAAVLIKGTTIGVTTNADGKYTINAPSGTATLVISFVGMKTQEIPITGRNVIDVELASESIGLQEVVVTALGITRSQKAVGYSVATVNSDEINQANQSSLMNSLQGKLAGVSVSTGGGLPGASTKVILRGYSSITGNNNPLYIVDGTPIDNTSRVLNGVDFGNGANDINPDDVETVTILKGAAATATYGSRAANGLIMITTKKGKMGERLHVAVASKTTFSNPLRLPQNQNVFGTGWNGIDDLTQNGSWGPAFDGKMRLWGNVVNNAQLLKPYVAVPSNIRDFFDTGTSFDNSISLSGGTDKASFYLSYNNATEDGMLPSNVDNHIRNSFSVKGTAKGKFMTMTATANYITTKGKNPPNGLGNSNASNLYSDILQIPRDISLIDLRDYKNNPFMNSDNFFTPYAYNPYYSMDQVGSKFDQQRFFGNFALDYQLMKDLKATWRAGIDFNNFNRDDWDAILTFTPGSFSDVNSKKGDPGYFSNYISSSNEMNSDVLLNYNKNVTEDINVNVIGGYNAHVETLKNLRSEVFSLDNPGFYSLQNSSSPISATPYRSEKKLYGIYGTADLSYKNYLYLTLSARRDWSSTLPVNANHFDTYSANASLILTELLPRLKNYLTFGKVRASYGTAGNDAPVYSINTTFVPTAGNTSIYIPYSNIGLAFPIRGTNSFRRGNQIGNDQLKPELSKDYEFGGDLRFLDSRVNFDLTYYHRNTSDQILYVPISPSSGYTTKAMNFGTVQNKGWEIAISVTPLKNADLNWTLTWTFSRNHSTVLSLAPGIDEVLITFVYDVDFVAIPHQPLGLFKGPVPLRDPQGHVVVNESGFVVSAPDKQIYGSSQPDFISGIISDFNYKGFHFGAVLDIRHGGLIYSGTADLQYFAGNSVKSLYNNRQPFIVPNSVLGIQDPITGNWTYKENTTPIDMANVVDYYYFTKQSSEERADVIPRSYVKLREVTLSYKIPKKFYQKTPFANAEIGLYGRNLLLWTPVGNNFIDPETTSYGNDLAGDFGEFRNSPTARQLGFSIKFEF